MCAVRAINITCGKESQVDDRPSYCIGCGLPLLSLILVATLKPKNIKEMCVGVWMYPKHLSPSGLHMILNGEDFTSKEKDLIEIESW